MIYEEFCHLFTFSWLFTFCHTCRNGLTDTIQGNFGSEVKSFDCWADQLFVYFQLIVDILPYLQNWTHWHNTREIGVRDEKDIPSPCKSFPSPCNNIPSPCHSMPQHITDIITLARDSIGPLPSSCPNPYLYVSYIRPPILSQVRHRSISRSFERCLEIANSLPSTTFTWRSLFPTLSVLLRHC